MAYTSPLRQRGPRHMPGWWSPQDCADGDEDLMTDEVIKHVSDLRAGDLVKNRHNGEVYLVAHNYGSEVILVLTKRVREGDGHNWRLHHRPEPEDNQLMIPAPACWNDPADDIWDEEGEDDGD